MIEAVVFDVGETLVNESRRFELWADWIDVPRLTFAATLGTVIAANRDYTDIFEIFHPGFDFHREWPLFEAEHGPSIRAEDLYPDVRQCFTGLRALGVWVGIAGNQPARTNALLRGFDLDCDFITTSAEWGVHKPDPAFFEKVAAAAPCSPDRILYVGDRVDNDVVPAKAAGLRCAFVLRGPWAWIHRDSPDAALADWRLTDLIELPSMVAADAILE